MRSGTSSLTALICITVLMLMTGLANGAECLGKWVQFQTGGYSASDEAPVLTVRIDDIFAISYPKPKELKVAEIVLKQPMKPPVRYEYVSHEEYVDILNCLLANNP